MEILVDAADVPPGRADESGRAVFAHLRPGEYAVDAATPDGTRAGGRARVAPAGTTTLRLVVVPGADEGGTSAVAEPSTIGPGRLFGPGELRGRPRPSDPWSFLRDVPGIVIDRVDVGGSETAQQSLVVSRGDPGSGVTWTLDGADVTDPAALGSTTLYADTDALGAIAVRTSALDARVRTAGVQVGLFTPSVGRAWSGAVHAAATGPQSDNLPGALRDRPFARPRTGRVFDLGAQAGGPVRRGRAWAWGAAGLDRLRQATAGGHDETLRLAWLSGRGVVRAGSGRLSLLATRSEKVHDDRDTTATAEEAARWRQSGPTHLVTLEDVRPWGRLSVLTRASFLDSGFSLRPRGGDANAYEDFRGIFRGSYQTFETHRPRIQAGTEAATSGRRVGFDHRVAAGVGYRRSTITTEARWPGNQVLGLERQTVFFRTFRLTGFALPTRAQSAHSVQEQAEVWIQDEARRGRLAATLGLRLDRLWGRNLASRVGANPVFPDLLPAVAYGGGPTSIRWTDVLPRAGLGFDLRRDGSMVARVGYGAYGAALGSGEVTFDNPVGREGASVTYYWRDANGDHAVQRNEIDRARGRLGTGGIVPDAPGIARSPHAVAPELRSPRTHETFVAFEHRGSRRLGGDVRVSWRRLVDPLWRPLAGLTLGDYVARGRVQGELQGESYDVVYFAPASTSRIVPGNGRVLSNRSGYFQDAWTFETSLGGRLGGLEWNAWGTLLDWREFFGDVPQSVQDPTPTESEPLRDGGTLAVRAGGLGRDAFVSARWTAGAAAAAPLLAGVRAALRLHARDGFPIPYFQVANTGDPTAGSKNVLVSPQLDRYRLPAVVVLDVRLSREFAVPGGHLTTSVDAFNALDSAATLQVVRDVELPAFDRPRELVRPRIVRFGLEYRFGGARRLQ